MTTIYVDIDDVLADFVPSACWAHRRPDPYCNPWNLGKWDMTDIFRMSNLEFWRPMRSVDFWADLPILPWAREIVDYCSDHFDEVYLCSCPQPFPNCYAGKCMWVERHFPYLLDHMILTSHKGLLADSGRVLLDDGDHNIQAWKKAGGPTVLFPRPWNSDHRLRGRTWRVARLRLDALLATAKEEE